MKHLAPYREHIPAPVTEQTKQPRFANVKHWIRQIWILAKMGFKFIFIISVFAVPLFILLHWLSHGEPGTCDIVPGHGKLEVRSVDADGRYVAEAFFDSRPKAIEYMKTLPQCVRIED